MKLFISSLLILLLLEFVLIITSTNAFISIPENIENTTILIPYSPNPYILESNIQVNNNGKLIIEPGVVIYYSSTTKFNFIDSILEINGNLTHKVVIKPIENQYQTKQLFNFTSSLIQMNFVNLETTSSLLFHESIVKIKNSILKVTNEINIFNCESSISLTNIQSSLNATYGSLTLVNSTITSYDSGVILSFMKSSIDYVHIQSYYYSINIFGLSHFKLTNSFMNGQLSYNDNNFGSNYLRQLFNSNSNLSISKSEIGSLNFYNNSALSINVDNSIIGSINSYDLRTPSIINLSLVNNSIESIYFSFSDDGNSYNFNMIGNKFHNQINYRCSNSINFQSAYFYLNIFNEYSTITFDNCFNINLKNNTFKNKYCPLSSRTLVTDPSLKLIDARFNYWFSLDEMEINERICYTKDYNLNYVYIYPPTDSNYNILTNVTETEIIIINEDNSIKGGYLKKDLELSNLNESYFIKGYLYISANVTVTIKPGVKLLFDYSAGLIVFGTLKIDSNELNDRIVFDKSSKNKYSKWYGVHFLCNLNQGLIENYLIKSADNFQINENCLVNITNVTLEFVSYVSMNRKVETNSFKLDRLIVNNTETFYIKSNGLVIIENSILNVSYFNAEFKSDVHIYKCKITSHSFFSILNPLKCSINNNYICEFKFDRSEFLDKGIQYNSYSSSIIFYLINANRNLSLRFKSSIFSILNSNTYGSNFLAYSPYQANMTIIDSKFRNFNFDFTLYSRSDSIIYLANNTFESCAFNGLFKSVNVVENKFENILSVKNVLFFIHLNNSNININFNRNNFVLANNVNFIDKLIHINDLNQLNETKIESTLSSILFNYNKISNLLKVNKILSTSLRLNSILDNGLFEIDARFNYWSSLNSSISVQKYIQDEFYDQNLIKINYIPFYEDNLMSILNDKPLPSFIDANKIGGSLNKNLDLEPLVNDVYYLISDVIIAENVIFKIKPGVVINVFGNYKIICNGDLILSGNLTNRIEINIINNIYNEQNDFKINNFIRFTEKSNKYKQSSIEYSTIYVNSNNFNTIIESYSKYIPLIDNLTIENTGILLNSSDKSKEINYAIYIQPSSYYNDNDKPLFKRQLNNDPINYYTINNTLLNGFSTGISFQSYKTLLAMENVHILNCLINFFDANTENLLIKNSKFELIKNSKNIYNLYLNSRSITILNTQFKSNNIKVCRLSFYSLIDLNLNNNYFDNYIIDANFYSTNNKEENNLLIESNHFKIDNNFQSSESLNAIYLNAYYSLIFENIQIIENYFEFKNSYEIIFFNFLFTGYSEISSNNLHSQMNIYNNIVNLINITSPKLFKTNSYYHTKQLDVKLLNNKFNYLNTSSFQNQPLIEITSNLNHFIHQNIFNINLNKTLTGNCPFKSIPILKPRILINASYNYFGQDQLDYLKYCKNDLTSNYFEYSPVYLDESLTKISNQIKPFINDQNRIIDGYLRHDEIIYCQDRSNYTEFIVTSDIIIPENLTLTINGSCRFRFLNNLNIIVEGSLIINGLDATYPVHLTWYERYKYWNGIEIYGDIKVNYLKLENSYNGLSSFDSNMDIANLHTNNINNAITMRSENLFKKTCLKLKSSRILSTNIYSESAEIYFDNVTFQGDLSIQSDKLCKMNIINSHLTLNYDHLNIYFNLKCNQTELILKNNSIIFSYLMSFDLNLNSLNDLIEIENNNVQKMPNYWANWFNRLQIKSTLNEHETKKVKILIRNNYFINVLFMIQDLDLDSKVSSRLNYIFDSNSFLNNFTFYAQNNILIFNVKNSIEFLNNTIYNSTFTRGVEINSFQNREQSTVLLIKKNKFLNNLPLSRDIKTYNLYISGDLNYEINENIFLNSRDLTYDLGIEHLSTRLINCSNNYWNAINETSLILLKRIDDMKNNYKNERLIIEPFLLNPFQSQNQENILCNITCSTNGFCIEGNKCKCDYGYTGLTCNEYKCQNECNRNGNCTGPNKCTCNLGYTGSDCSIFSCENNCNNRGICIGYNKCSCYSGWTGKSCEQYTCSYNCSNNGKCIGPNQCSCNQGYSGLYCNQYICESNCNNKGYCTGINKCSCFSGYTGDLCEQFTCSLNCSNNGKCIGANQCLCNQGYTGYYCNQFICETNCNNKGYCIGINKCSCNSGWTGNDCSIFECVNGCLNNGTCVGPNQCKCTNEWTGSRCDRPVCTNNCNNRGNCKAYDVCECYSQYKGKYCDLCADNTWGNNCNLCPNCLNGKCNKSNGKCDCIWSNWSGDLCNKCSFKFYGPNCLPETRILNVAPTSMYILTDTEYIVNIKAHNLWTNSSYSCIFDEYIQSQAILIDNESLRCKIKSSDMKPGEVSFKIENKNTSLVTYYNFKLLFYKNCTNNCNQNGYCQFGICSCSNTWKGLACETKIIEPKFKKVNDFYVNEFDDFTYKLELEQGTRPVYYQIINTNVKAELIDSSQIRWSSVFSEQRVNQITVKVSNEIGVDYLYLNVIIRPKYKPILLSLKNTNFQSRPDRILLSGSIVDVNDTSKIIKKSVPIKLIIKSNYYKNDIVLNLITSNDGIFFYDYFTRSGEHGLFEAYSIHPLDGLDSGNKIEWTINGLLINETYIQFNGLIDDNYEREIMISNLNSFDLTNLRYSYENNDVFEIKAVNYSTNILIEKLAPNKNINFTIKFSLLSQSNVDFSGTIYVYLLTDEEVNNRIQLWISLNRRKPNLLVDMNKFEFRILNGEKKFFDFELLNKGTIQATNLTCKFIQKEHEFKVIDENEMFNLNINEKKRVYFTLTISEQDKEGTYNEILFISNKNTYVLIQLKYFITKSNDVELNIAVEDEFTYFADNKPFLANSTITISSPYSGFRQSLRTNSTGLVTFSNLTENYYNIYAMCDNHVSKSLIWEPKSFKNYMNIFLERITVKIEWTVVPVLFEDKYEIKLSSTFETFVPVPVVVISPLYFDLEKLETGLLDTITLTITNYGLIRADNFTFNLPIFDTIRLEFETPYEIFNLEANSTVNVRIKVFKNENSISLTQIGRKSQGSCTEYMYIYHAYECGPIRVMKAQIVTIGKTCSSSDQTYQTFGQGQSNSYYLKPGGSGAGHPHIKVPSVPSFEIPCDPCLAAFTYCYLKNRDLVNCLTATYHVTVCIGSRGTPGVCKYEKLAKSSQECLKGIMEFECEEVPKYCFNQKNKRAFSPFLHKEDIIESLISSIEALDNINKLSLETYGNAKWLDIDSNDWFRNEFEILMSDSSDQGAYITQSELNSLLSKKYPNNITESLVRELVERFNNTQYLNDFGKLNTNSTNYINKTRISYMTDRFNSDYELANKYGFNDIYNWFIGSRDAYNKAPSKQGSCAKIRLVISQSLILTREGFEAKLQIENQEENPLTNIIVLFKIKRVNDSYESNHLFSIGKPKLDQMTSVDGDGSIGSKQSGVSTWLLIPYREAAEFKETDYYIGGQLSYTTGGKNIKTDLSSEKITVKPESKLELFYFLEKNVLSDDPFTPEREPAIPFVLGLFIFNKGYGPAKSLKIESSQPEIVENEKGLLIDFKIENAYLNNKQVENSLRVDFGDLNSFELKQVIWQLKSSLSGTFKNLNVTLMNTNPNGDPKLSIINKLEYKQLMKMVKLDQPTNLNDHLLDFLVLNEFTLKPDKVYVSNVYENSLDVQYVENVTFYINKLDKSIEIKLNLNNVYSNKWFYSAININTIELNSFDHFLKTTRVNDGHILQKENVWITKFTNDLSLIHLFDYNQEKYQQKELNEKIYLINFYDEQEEHVTTKSSTHTPISTDFKTSTNYMPSSISASNSTSSSAPSPNINCTLNGGCLNNGICVGIDKCNCTSDWSGSNCQIPTNNKSSTHSPISTDFKTSTNFITSSSPTSSSAPSPNINCTLNGGCLNNGICIGINLCNCTSEWTGFNCQINKKLIFKMVRAYYLNGQNDISLDYLVLNENTLLPDKLYFSNINRSSLPRNVTYVDKIKIIEMKEKSVKLNLDLTEYIDRRFIFFYYSVIDINTNDLKYFDKYIKIIRDNQHSINEMPNENVWITRYNEKTSKIHVFDYFMISAASGNEKVTYEIYSFNEEFECENNCSNSGYCIGSNTCKCKIGRTGLLCENYVCLNNCNNRGTCVNYYTCSCQSGWTGIDCSQSQCTLNGGCLNNGICVGIDKCNCTSDWSGSNCQIPTNNKSSTHTPFSTSISASSSTSRSSSNTIYTTVRTTNINFSNTRTNNQFSTTKSTNKVTLPNQSTSKTTIKTSIKTTQTTSTNRTSTKTSSSSTTRRTTINTTIRLTNNVQFSSTRSTNPMTTSRSTTRVTVPNQITSKTTIRTSIKTTKSIITTKRTTTKANLKSTAKNVFINFNFNI